jgi:hypothetical protein
MMNYKEFGRKRLKLNKGIIVVFSGGTEEEHGRDSNQTSPEYKFRRDTGTELITGLTMGDLTVGITRSGRER